MFKGNKKLIGNNIQNFLFYYSQYKIKDGYTFRFLPTEKKMKNLESKYENKKSKGN